jgi:hypothetical protein
MQSKVWSNFFFIIPLLITLISMDWIHSFLISGTAYYSFKYHSSSEKKYFIRDNLFGWSIIIYHIYLLYLFFPPIWYLAIIIFFVLLSGYYLLLKRKDDFEWHFTCVIITTLSALLRYM